MAIEICLSLAKVNSSSGDSLLKWTSKEKVPRGNDFPTFHMLYFDFKLASLQELKGNSVKKLPSGNFT